MKAQHARAVKILSENRRKLDELAQCLYESESITGERFMEILNAAPAAPEGVPAAENSDGNA